MFFILQTRRVKVLADHMEVHVTAKEDNSEDLGNYFSGKTLKIEKGKWCIFEMYA